MMKRDINPGIARTVKLFNDAGFRTCDSGDGETHLYECDRDWPYVTITCDGHNLQKISHAVVDFIRRVFDVAISSSFSEEPGVVYVQPMYCPLTEVGIIDVNGIHDRFIAQYVLDLGMFYKYEADE